MRILYLALLAAAACAQDAPRHFLVELTVAAGVDVTRLTPPQMALFQQHGAHLMKLREEGTLILGGHTDNPQSVRAVIIVKAKDTAAARALADADPAVKAGILKPAVEPFTLAIPPK